MKWFLRTAVYYQNISSFFMRINHVFPKKVLWGYHDTMVVSDVMSDSGVILRYLNDNPSYYNYCLTTEVSF